MFLVLSILRNFETRNPFGSFIINLSIADIFSGVFVQLHVLLEKFNIEMNNSSIFFKALETSSRSITLMFLVVLSFYLIFSLISQVTVEKYFTPEDTFIIIFIIWSLIGGIHLVYHKIKSKCIVYDDKFSNNDFFDMIFTVILLFQLLTAFYLKYKQNLFRYNVTDETVNRYNNFGLSHLSSPAFICYTDRSMKSFIKLQSILFIIFWLPYFITIVLIFNGVNWDYIHNVSTFTSFLGTMKGFAACIGTFIVYPDCRIILQNIKETILTIRD
ncbi:hypothetical protein ACKWTF_009971 [Chironomus riparius]